MVGSATRTGIGSTIDARKESMGIAFPKDYGVRDILLEGSRISTDTGSAVRAISPFVVVLRTCFSTHITVHWFAISDTLFSDISRSDINAVDITTNTIAKTVALAYLITKAEVCLSTEGIHNVDYTNVFLF